eukprot:COSAG03_NODE_25762_length_263_cov_1.262195_1_plen_42_part_10
MRRTVVVTKGCAGGVGDVLGVVSCGDGLTRNLHHTIRNRVRT